MSLPNLDNLVKTGQLKLEPINQLEFSGLLRSGEARLHDAANPSLAAESQFDLAYNAAHSLSLAALRWQSLKIDAINLIKEQGYSCSEAFKSLDISYDLLNRWIRESKKSDANEAFRGNGKLTAEQL